MKNVLAGYQIFPGTWNMASFFCSVFQISFLFYVAFSRLLFLFGKEEVIKRRKSSWKVQNMLWSSQVSIMKLSRSFNKSTFYFCMLTPEVFGFTEIMICIYMKQMIETQQKCWYRSVALLSNRKYTFHLKFTA